MRAKLSKFLLLLILCACCGQHIYAKKIHNKRYKFVITVPESLRYVADTAMKDDGDMYYDSTVDVILLISGRDSKFNSVTDYIDCTREELEKELKNSFSDTSLYLLSCNRFSFFTDEITVLHFREEALPFGFNTYTIFFIHYKHKDVQLAFTYKKETEQKSSLYINKIMETIRLK